MKKTLTLAFAAAFLTAAPLATAFAADTAPAAAEAPANKSKDSKKWEVGDRLPGTYAGNAFKADATALNLPSAPAVHQWFHVTDNAYLVNTRNLQIVKIVGVAKKS